MSGPSPALRFLYRTAPGRCLLWLLTRPGLSRAAGAFLSCRASVPIIKPFVKSKGLDLREYPERAYSSFNDFFTRDIKPGLRPFDPDPEALCAPCDGKVSVYKATPDGVFTVKNSQYRLSSLLEDETLARAFYGGTVLVFRLCVEDYHRYAWFDGGTPGEGRFIPGVLHTVQPIAFERYPVFIRNSREWRLIQSDSFGAALQMEVGALLVGRIDNRPVSGPVGRGDEKGRFLFGGSTVVLLLGPGAATLEQKYWDATAKEEELQVRMGQPMGHK